jgi:hypothetical protein
MATIEQLALREGEPLVTASVVEGDDFGLVRAPHDNRPIHYLVALQLPLWKLS